MRFIQTATLIVILGSLTGCAHQITHIARPIAPDDARAIVERVLMEQPAKHRPSMVAFSDTFLAMQMGTARRGTVVAVPVGFATVSRVESIATELNTRIYYDSIAGTRLHKKRDWYMLDIHAADGRIFERVYCRDEAKALKFIDAIEALRRLH